MVAALLPSRLADVPHQSQRAVLLSLLAVLLSLLAVILAILVHDKDSLPSDALDVLLDVETTFQLTSQYGCKILAAST